MKLLQKNVVNAHNIIILSHAVFESWFPSYTAHRPIQYNCSKLDILLFISCKFRPTIEETCIKSAHTLELNTVQRRSNLCQ